MNIYLIVIDDQGYDTFQGHVICAYNEDQVKKLAKEKSASEGQQIWDSAIIEDLGLYMSDENAIEPFIILSDFNAG